MPEGTPTHPSGAFCFISPVPSGRVHCSVKRDIHPINMMFILLQPKANGTKLLAV